MAVRLRLRRTGAKNKACYRIVAADGRSPRDGRFIEILGYYDPRHQDEKIDLERADYWISHGAQPSDTVSDVIKRAKDPSARSLKTPRKKKESEEQKPVDDTKVETTDTPDTGKTPKEADAPSQEEPTPKNSDSDTPTEDEATVEDSKES